MRELERIRQLYFPYHPVRKLKSTIVSYSEFLPRRSLQLYIFHYWEMKTLARLESDFQHKVIPNGCVDLYFEISRPHQSFITGLSDKYSSMSAGYEFHYIGVCFVPTIAPQLYRIDSSELHNRHESLSNLAPSTAEYIQSEFSPGLNQQRIKKLLDKHFTKEISRIKFRCDPRLFNALHEIFLANGQLRVESDLDVGLSARQLRRVFNTYVGDNPKSFARTVRFQKCLQANILAPKTEYSFYDFGYYDQVHYIKDFKRLYGVTPSKVDSHQ